MPAGAALEGDGHVAERFAAFDAPAVVRQFGDAHAVALDDADEEPGQAQGVETASVVAPVWFHRAVRSRQRGYVAGRHCASMALTRYGSSAAQNAVETGAFGAPLWPAGVTGSITHSAKVALAVVASRHRWRSVGIDCEPVIEASTAADVADRILPEQRDIVWIGEWHRTLSFEETLTIGFAAKESIYKCLNPVVNEFFGFDAVRLQSIDMARGIAHFVLLRALSEAFVPDTPLTVHFSLEHNHVFAASGLTAR